jgi:tetratricopeptide (TPR) repeat protein
LVVVQRAYEKLPADQPQIRAHALRGIAESYEGLGKLDQAIATYRETIQKYRDSPQTPWAHICGAIAARLRKCGGAALVASRAP